MAFSSLLLALFQLFAPIFNLFMSAPAPQNPADDFTPVVRFVAASDSHITTFGDQGCIRIAKTLKAAYAYADADADYKNLDAIVISGDITDRGALPAFTGFVAATDAVLRNNTQRLAILGRAHDTKTFGTDTRKNFEAITGQDADFHKVINGFHFIGISGNDDPEIHYTDKQIEWLDKEIAKAVLDNPAKPVFVFQHEHISNTVYGSSDFDGWGMTTFANVLEKYPQVVDISGHSHYPANDPRAIWQGTYTAINDGSLAYYEFTVDEERTYHPETLDNMCQSLIVEVDADNCVRVRVLDANAGKIVAEYMFNNVASPLKLKYSPAVRILSSVAPVFDNDAKLEVKNVLGSYRVTVPQATITGDNEVFLYRITVTDTNGNETYSAWKLSGYYLPEKPDSITFDSFKASAGSTIKVVAEDVWGNQSDALTVTL